MILIDVRRRCLQGKGRPQACSLSSFLLRELLQDDLKDTSGRRRRLQLLHGLRTPKDNWARASCYYGIWGPDCGGDHGSCGWQACGAAPVSWGSPPCQAQPGDGEEVSCHGATKSSPYHRISSYIIRYLGLIAVFLYSCIMTCITMYHVVS